MSVLSVTQQPTGQVGVNPNVIQITTNDTYATVTVTGYLTTFKQAANLNVFANDQMALVYTSDEGPVWLKVVVTSNTISLVQISSPGDVTLPTIASNIIVSTDTAGTLANTTGTAINRGSLQAGLSGDEGTLISYSSTAARGSLIVAAVANTGNTNVTISNAAHGQASVYSIPDVGAATGLIVANETQGLMKSVTAAAAAGGAAAQSFTDAFCTATSTVVGNWNTQANAASVLKIVPGVGSFVVTSSANAGVGTFAYIIMK